MKFNATFNKIIKEQDYFESENEGSEIVVEIYLRRESSNMDPAKLKAFRDIKAKLEAKNYAVEPYKNTLKNGSTVLELTVHTSSDWNQAVDFDTKRIEQMLGEYEHKAVYMAGFPE